MKYAESSICRVPAHLSAFAQRLRRGRSAAAPPDEDFDTSPWPSPRSRRSGSGKAAPPALFFALWLRKTSYGNSSGMVSIRLVIVSDTEANLASLRLRLRRWIEEVHDTLEDLDDGRLVQVRPAQNGLDLPEQHPRLRHRVFGVGRNGLPVLAGHHELMPRAGMRAVETERPEAADEFPPLNWSPAGHFESY